MTFLKVASEDAASLPLMEKIYLGIEIGGTKLQIVTGDAGGAILQRWRHTVDREAGGAGIRGQIATTLKEILPKANVAGVGVGFGGPVDSRTGRICCSHHIEGWSEFKLGEWLGELTGSPVRVDNDANVAALGESRRGAGKGFDPVFYVTMGSGVGGGLVVNGIIYHGATPGESEIGHVRLDKTGTIVENRCSGWAVDRRIREALPSHPESLLNSLAGGEHGGEARHLGAALAARDALALHILNEAAEDVAFALSHVTHLMHPRVIVLGGGLSLLGEPLRSAVAEQLPRFIMQAFAPGPEVRLAALREDSVPMGALVLAQTDL